MAKYTEHQITNELERIKALQRYEILDTPPDGAFDNVTFLASKLLNVPIAIVSLVDSDRIWFKSHYGTEVSVVPKIPGLCASAILSNAPYIINNARLDPRTLSNPLVAGKFGLQFYVGIPLTTNDNFNLGTLCVIDFKARELPEVELKMLQSLAQIVMDQMELRLRARQIDDLNKSLDKVNKALKVKSSHDYLTGLWNREAILEKLHEILTVNEAQLLSILIIDIDHFKEINDTYGHVVGDMVLSEVGKRLEMGVRQQDFVGRIGGDEFLIIMPNNFEQVEKELANRLLHSVCALPITIDYKNQQEIVVSISIGIYNKNEELNLNQSELLARADDGLFQAKKSGKNCFRYGE